MVDYGRIEVASPDLGVEQALTLALREFRDRVLEGWSREQEKPMLPNTVWIDAGYMTDVVYKFCREYNGFLPAVGRSQRYPHFWFIVRLRGG